MSHRQDMIIPIHNRHICPGSRHGWLLLIVKKFRTLGDTSGASREHPELVARPTLALVLCRLRRRCPSLHTRLLARRRLLHVLLGALVWLLV